MTEQDVGGWNENAKLVLNELKKINERLDIMERDIDEKFDRRLNSFDLDKRELYNRVHDLEIEIAVTKREVAWKSSAFAFGVSFVCSLVTIITTIFF